MHGYSTPLSTLDLPRPGASALAVRRARARRARLDADPRLPWIAGGSRRPRSRCGAVRAVRAQRELAAVRRTRRPADRARAAQLETRPTRALALQRADDARAARAARAARSSARAAMLDPRPAALGVAAPARRPRAACRGSLRGSSPRGSPTREPVAARGVLLARRSCATPAARSSPTSRARSSRRALRRVLGALEP